MKNKVFLGLIILLAPFLAGFGSGNNPFDNPTGPFGIPFAMPIDEVRVISIDELIYKSYIFVDIMPPIRHPFLTHYSIEASEAGGACAINVRSPNGMSLENRDQLMLELKEKFGSDYSQHELLGWHNFDWEFEGRSDKVGSLNYRYSLLKGTDFWYLHLRIDFENGPECFSKRLDDETK